MQPAHSALRAALCAALLATASCSPRNSTEETGATSSQSSVTTTTAAPGTAGTAIAEARAALQAGQVDEAAAKLARLQSQGATFDAAQAKDYRQALSDAYDRAIEAAQRGDPKAQAALQLLRAAAPR